MTSAMRMGKPFPWALFLLGMGEALKFRIVAMVSFSLLFCFLSAPFMFFMDYQNLRRHGFMPLLSFALMSLVGVVASSLYNGNPSLFVFKGFMGTYVLFAFPVVCHWFLSRNLGGLKWYFVGSVMSAIISIFVFKGAGEENMASISEAAEGPLFLLMHFGPLSALPVNAFYLTFPLFASVAIMWLPLLYTVMNSVTGRGAVVGTLITTALLVFAKQKTSRMVVLRRRFTTIFCAILAFSVLSASAYKSLALHGFLSDAAREKYESQSAFSKSKNTLVSVLVGGRSDFFATLTVLMHHPVMGLGAFPVDKNGYADDFMQNYASDAELRRYTEEKEKVARERGALAGRFVSQHSYILGNWVRCGILGLPYWLYVLCIIWRLMKSSIDAVPQWFGYFAIALPGTVFGIFFSPYGGDLGSQMLITAMLVAIAIGKGKIRLPVEMQIEAAKHW